MAKLKLKFTEREFFRDEKTGTVPGYERAAMVQEGKLVLGRVINLDKLEKAECIDTVMFETELDFKAQAVDIAQILKKDEGGKKWLNGLRVYYKENYEEDVSTDFVVELQDFTPLELVKFPTDYFKRDRNYRPPEGFIEKMPKNCIYAKIIPPVKFKTGEWIPGVVYERKAIRKDGVVEDISYSEKYDKSGLLARGVLIGKLDENEVSEKRGDFEWGFPLETYLSVVHRVSLRTAHKYNPRHIEVYRVD
jgi:hypothetical protein